MADSYEKTLKELFRTLSRQLQARVKDEECPPAVYKEAREFLKDNSITKDTLDVASFDDLSKHVPLEEFDEDDGATAH